MSAPCEACESTELENSIPPLRRPRRESGVKNITWTKSRGWAVQYFENESRRRRLFSLSHFMKQGLTEDEADAKALEAAKACRAELVRQGLLSELKAQPSSHITWVAWDRRNKWRVHLSLKTVPGEKPKKIFGGYFVEKAAAEAKALELAETHGLCKATGELQDVKMTSQGVQWNKEQQLWLARILFFGKRRQFRVKPKDLSSEELQRSFREAVAWRKKQEKLKAKRKAKERRKEKQKEQTATRSQRKRKAGEGEGEDGNDGSAPEVAQTRRTTARNLSKQSGVENVRWNREAWAWQVEQPKWNSEGKKRVVKIRVFSVSHFMKKEGLTEDQADAKALEAAKAFRARMVREGLLPAPKAAKDPKFCSDVVGVTWKKQRQRWRVHLCSKTSKKGIFGGHFKEKAAAEAKAREMASQEKAAVTPIGRLEELRDVKPKVPYVGVRWNKKQQQWSAQLTTGKCRAFHVKPKDFSEAELERSFQEAVAWHKAQTAAAAPDTTNDLKLEQKA